MYVTARDVPYHDEPDGEPDDEAVLTESRPADSGRRGRSGRGGRVATTVILMGSVSMLTDISSESVNAILPLYLTTFLGLSAVAFGVVDGIYQGISALVRILGGWAADRFDHPKWVATIGYALSAASRILLIPAHTFGAVTTSVTIDRLGKGLRTAPRDAVIAASTPREQLGRAFGVHRALDTLGALIGPLLAFFLLLHVANDFHSVFVTSFVFAIIGVAVLVFFVPDLRPRREAATHSKGEVTRPSLRRLANPQVGRLVAAAVLLGLVTIGDGFLYLELTHRDSLATKYFPLLYVGTNFAYLALAVPAGRIADRIGRVRVFLGGHVLLLGAYLFAVGPVAGGVTTIVCLLLLGAYYAATDGVLAAISGQLVDPSVRTSGIATAQTAVAIARFAASLGFGVAWVTLGRVEALWLVTGLLAVVIPAAAVLMRGITRAADRRLGVPA